MARNCPECGSFTRVDSPPAPGTKVVRLLQVYRVQEVGEDEVRLTTQHAGREQEVTETRRRFDRDLAEGVAVVHPDCTHCGLPVDPAEGEDGPLHYECWFQQASVAERCAAEVERPGGNHLAAEALRADSSPRSDLLEVVGDPARTLHDRNDAEALLTHAVDTGTLVEALVRCPECLEGEVFEMNSATGAVTCHCGHPMKPAEQCARDARCESGSDEA